MLLCEDDEEGEGCLWDVGTVSGGSEEVEEEDEDGE